MTRAVDHGPTTSASTSRARTWFRPALIGLLATVLALVNSWHVSLWKDEVDSLSASSRGIDGLWRLIHRIDAVHALYYLVLELWTSVAGRSPFTIRLPSAVATGLAAAGVVALAMRVASPRVAWLAGVVFAVLPRVTWMGIEARPFALSGAAGVWLTYVFVRAWQAPLGRQRRYWIGYAVLAGVSVTVNIYLALLVVAHGLSILVHRDGRERWRAWLTSVVAAAVLSTPVVVAAASQRGQLGDTRVGPLQTVRSVVINQWFLGATPTPDGALGGAVAVDGPGDLWRVGAPLLALLCWTLVVVGLRHSLRSAPDAAEAATLLLLAVVVPTVLVVGYSLTVSPMYNPRYFCFAAFAVAILIAIGLDALARRWQSVTAVVAIVALAAPVYVSQRTVTGKGSDWSLVAGYLATHARPGDGVYFAPRDTPAPAALTVGATSRYIAMAYPDGFAQLRDVTLLRTGPQDNSLTGTSRQLADAVGELRRLSTVWVVRWRDYPVAERQGDDQVMRQAGLRLGSEHWIGSADAVVEFVR